MGSLQTSLESWNSLQPVLGGRQRLVYQAVCDLGEVHCRTIAEYLQLRSVVMIRNDVASRMNELHKKGLVMPGKIVFDSATKKQVVCWKSKNKMEMM